MIQICLFHFYGPKIYTRQGHLLGYKAETGKIETKIFWALQNDFLTLVCNSSKNPPTFLFSLFLIIKAD